MAKTEVEEGAELICTLEQAKRLNKRGFPQGGTKYLLYVNGGAYFRRTASVGEAACVWLAAPAIGEIMGEMRQHPSMQVPLSVAVMAWIKRGGGLMAALVDAYCAQAARDKPACPADLAAAARCAVADLEGLLPIVDASGDRTHPGWRTLEELKAALDAATAGARRADAGGREGARMDKRTLNEIYDLCILSQQVDVATLKEVYDSYISSQRS